MSRQTSFILYTDNTLASRNKAAPSVAAGRRLVVRVPAPVEGRVHRLTVFQESGTAVAFTVQLLASAVPYGGPAVDAAYNAAPLAPVDPYKVIPAQTALAGAVLDWRAQDSAGGASGCPYVNMDQASRTEAQPYLYLVIIPTAAAGTTKWCVTLVFDQATS